MYYVVYKITNTINGKEYTGVHKTKNINDNYMGSGKYLKYSQNKYGLENFSKEIIFRAVTEDVMYWVERMIVDDAYVNDSNTYNLKIGGTTQQSGAWKLATLYNIGKTFSESRIRVHSAALKKYYKTNKNANYGTVYICNDETREQLQINENDVGTYLLDGCRQGFLKVCCNICGKLISEKMIKMHQKSKSCKN